MVLHLDSSPANMSCDVVLGVLVLVGVNFDDVLGNRILALVALVFRVGMLHVQVLVLAVMVLDMVILLV